MTDLRWKRTDTYVRPEYAGYTDIVLLAWSRHPDGETLTHFGCGWLDQFSSKWTDCSDKKPWPEQPTHWLCSLRGTFPQDNRD